jgi:hypothetical protein
MGAISLPLLRLLYRQHPLLLCAGAIADARNAIKIQISEILRGKPR